MSITSKKKSLLWKDMKITEKRCFPGTYYFEQGHLAEPAHTWHFKPAWSWGNNSYRQMGAWFSFTCVIIMFFFQSRTRRRWRVDACVLVFKKARDIYFIGSYEGGFGIT